MSAGRYRVHEQPCSQAGLGGNDSERGVRGHVRTTRGHIASAVMLPIATIAATTCP